MIKARLILSLFFVYSCFSYSYEVVLVTGASRGIGASIANQLASDKFNRYKVYAGVRNLSSKNELIPSANLQITELDVIYDQSIAVVLQEILQEEGRIDVLINNAGIMAYGSHENVLIDEAKKMFEVNYFGVIRVTQAVLPSMREHHKGRIIQIGSRSGFRPLPSLSVYGDSKAALLSASQSMAATLTPWNIKVSVIEPGPVMTDLDANSPYCSRLNRCEDPFFEIFKQADLLAPPPGSTLGAGAQLPSEIAEIVQRVIETDEPALRYQTTDNIRMQAAKRSVDPTGNSDVEELREILFGGL